MNLGALDFQGILEEMRLDGLEELEDEARVRELIRQRQVFLSSESKQVTKVANHKKFDRVCGFCLFAIFTSSMVCAR